jgi:carbonic anhydrase/acetyltransferase-like protein (isoleucine patch superfamily)
VAANAVVIGDVGLGDDPSVRYTMVIRGDIHWIRIGPRSNLQDGVIIHVEHKNSYLSQGNGRPLPRPPGENAS